MSVKGVEGSLPNVNAEILDEDRFILHSVVCRWIWSLGFLHNLGPKAKGMWIYPNRFNVPKPNTDSGPDAQIGEDQFFSNR